MELLWAIISTLSHMLSLFTICVAFLFGVSLCLRDPRLFNWYLDQFQYLRNYVRRR